MNFLICKVEHFPIKDGKGDNVNTYMKCAGGTWESLDVCIVERILSDILDGVIRDHRRLCQGSS